MRLISLVLALAIIAILLVNYKDAIFSPKTDSDETVVESSRKIIFEAAKRAGVKKELIFIYFGLVELHSWCWRVCQNRFCVILAVGKLGVQR